MSEKFEDSLGGWFLLPIEIFLLICEWSLDFPGEFSLLPILYPAFISIYSALNTEVAAKWIELTQTPTLPSFTSLTNTHKIIPLIAPKSLLPQMSARVKRSLSGHPPSLLS